MGLSERETRLSKAITARGPALLDDLRRHVALPTGMGNAAALDESRHLLTRRLAALGASVSMIPGLPHEDWLYELNAPARGAVPPTAVCHRLHRPGTRCRVLLCGHLDTVHDPKGTFLELTLSADGKTATGPGCVDMKGGLVIAVAALEALDECGIDASWGFILNSDEETGSYHSDAAMRAETASFDVGLVLEPALPDGGLVVERPGSGQFMIECRGRPAHVGRDFTSGVSAVTALSKVVLAVAAMAQPDRGMIASVGPLEGGSATNIVPDRARAWGNVRFRTPALGDDLARRLDALATAPDAMPAVRILRSFNRPAKPLAPAAEALAGVARTAAEDLGQKL